MWRTTRYLASALALSLLALAAPAQVGVFLDGRWEGRVDLGAGGEELALRLFPANSGLAPGGLLDLPARGLFGYPMDRLERDSEGLSFTLLGGGPFDGRFELSGSPDPIGPGKSFAVSGLARFVPAGKAAPALAHAPGATQGPFSLSYSGSASRGEAFGGNFSIDTGRGRLPGSLLLPETPGSGPVPLVLILAGAGADRDGDNPAVPGRSDCLAALARSLQARGLASLRFDKRGTGEAYRLGEREEDLRFDDHVSDAGSAIALLLADSRFSSLTILGHGEGALVGAAALAFLHVGLPGAARIRGLVALCSSGRSERELVEAALASTPPELKAEASAIMFALETGRTWPHPSPRFEDFFRPSIQPYLASMFRYDPRSAFAAFTEPALVIAGERDLQVGLPEAELLAGARPDSAYRVVPGMSHALKYVGEDEEANYASFTDPSLPLAEGLPELVAAFALGAELPGVDPR
jgi:uncharacterized protein